MTDFDLSPWTEAAVALCEYACGYAHGRSKDDEVYAEVTEHRDFPADRPFYSSCGDLPHWMAMRLGVREPWVNRQSLGHYHVGMNIAELGLGCPISHDAPRNIEWSGPSAGDICEIWNGVTGRDAHVFVVLGPGSDAHHLRTANYGAGGMNAAPLPGAVISDSKFEHCRQVNPTTGRLEMEWWQVGTRQLRRIIKLYDLVALSKTPPDLTGAKLTGEVIDAVKAVKWTNQP